MRKTIHAAAAAILAWSAGGTLAARAADLTMPPAYEPDSSPIVEIGSGWYLRADANVYNASYNSEVFGSLDNANFGATLGIGYQFNSMFRVDATADYMTPVTRTGMVWPQTFGGLIGVTGGAALPPAGYAVATGGQGCSLPLLSTYGANTSSAACEKASTYAYLLNGYLDLGHWYGLTPYIGAGAGLGYLQAQTSLEYYNGLAFAYGYRDRTQYNFAYALMAGFSYDISNMLKLDIGYRYLNLGPNTSAQEFRAGVRITPDG
ncbi:outer membrane beta-barrel protein [Rhodoblastus sp.]|jgi:opacity protein-like surface antigen|uniref:outer membrane protein n=1 Tax=Rhodoblastus sp. TaxID=1962975 RepID=UPI0026330E7D|nr:outer membrane beta-barrel protein [Rhodoblastus sp.]